MVVVLASLALLAPAAAHVKPVAVAPAPAWVVEAPELPDAAPDVDGPLVFRLIDEQVQVGATVERHRHEIRRVLTSAGAEEASRVLIDFDPASQKLVLNAIKIRRGAKEIDGLPGARMQVIQREEQAEDQIYDGTLQALLLLSDVRPGDEVDTAYTLTGDNPSLRGRYVDEIQVGFGLPVDELRVRVSVPQNRKMEVRTRGVDYEPEVDLENGMRVYEWDLEDVPPVAPEDDLPESYDPYPFVQFSEFSGWADVARWAAPYYRAARSATVDAEAERIRALGQGEEERFLQALRFVQDDIRYLGIETGRSAHVPAQPTAVLERRYGDCKEKALLLVQLLERLGIRAWPALVATDFGPGLGELLPSPWDFDHVIVKAEVGGHTVWADATQSLQRGPLTLRQPPPFGLALVVDPASASLEKIPAPQPGDLMVEEDYTPDGDGARLLMTRTYRGEAADELRRRLSREGRGSVERDLMNDVAATEPEADQEGPFVLADDENKDTIRLTSHWKVPPLMDGGSQTFYASSLDEKLVRPRIALRSMPLSVQWPQKTQYVVRAHLPGRFKLPQEQSGKVEGPALRLTWSSKAQTNDVEVQWTLESLHDRVSPEAIRDHLDSIDDIEGALSFQVSADEAPAKAAHHGPTTLQLLALMAAVVLGTIGVAGTALVLVLRRR